MGLPNYRFSKAKKREVTRLEAHVDLVKLFITHPVTTTERIRKFLTRTPLVSTSRALARPRKIPSNMCANPGAVRQHGQERQKPGRQW